MLIVSLYKDILIHLWSVMFRRNWIRERIFKEYLFTYFRLCWSLLSCFLQLQCASFSLQRLLLLWSKGSRVQAQELWRMGLVAQHVGPSQTRD